MAVYSVERLISLFYNDYPEKPTVTITPVDSALSITRPTIKSTKLTQLQQKRGRLTKNRANKHTKKS